MKHSLSLITLLMTFPAIAENSRQLDAHEHGVGTLNIAIEGSTVAMELEAPGFDIVGFEYTPTSEADLAAVDTALAALSAPLDLFVLPEMAACSVFDAHAELEGEDAHAEHDDDHHEDHEEGDHKDEGHDDGDHKDEDHKDEDHDEDEHEDEQGHAEFHAEYTLSCEKPEALTQIKFAYFEAFPKAEEVEVQIIDGSGARAFEVLRGAPILDLDG